jgi:hypothetical protein
MFDWPTRRKTGSDVSAALSAASGESSKAKRKARYGFTMVDLVAPRSSGVIGGLYFTAPTREKSKPGTQT